MSFDKFSDNFAPILNLEYQNQIKENCSKKTNFSQIVEEKFDPFQEENPSTLNLSKDRKITDQSIKTVKKDNAEELISKFEEFASEYAKPQENFDDLPSQGMKNPLSTSRIMRMQASMEIHKEEIQKFALKDLSLKSEGSLNFNSNEVKGLLEHYGVNLKDLPQDYDKLNLEDLCRAIENLKQQGTYYQQNCLLVKKTIEMALTQVSKENEIKFLKVIKNRLDECLGFAIQTKNIIFEPYPKEEKFRMLAENILDKVNEHAASIDHEDKETGVLIQAGWSAPPELEKKEAMGHWIFLEIKKRQDGKYLLMINNAGAGAQYHAKRKEKLLVTKIYEIDSRETTTNIVKNILSQEAESRNSSDENLQKNDKLDFSYLQAQIFYHHFEVSGCKRFNPKNLTPRLPQRTGNCGIRNLFETIFYISQRLNAIEASNAIQTQRKEMVKKFVSEFGYKALAKAVDTLQKEAIVPLVQEPQSFETINEAYFEDIIDIKIAGFCSSISKFAFNKIHNNPSIDISQFEKFLHTEINCKEIENKLKEYFPQNERFNIWQASKKYQLLLNELSTKLADKNSIKIGDFIKMACVLFANHFDDFNFYIIDLQIDMLFQEAFGT